MRLGDTLQFPGSLGEHNDPNGIPCGGRMFFAKQVGVGGVYFNMVECLTCRKELPAAEDRLRPEPS
jgi:hypothetical protein